MPKPQSNEAVSAETEQSVNVGGRPGVTRDDVARAMATLASQGRKTSLRNIRSVLNRGSNSTIQKHRQAVLLDQTRETSTLDESSEVAELHAQINELTLELTLALYGTMTRNSAESLDEAIGRNEKDCADRIARADNARDSAEEDSKIHSIRFKDLQNVNRQLEQRCAQFDNQRDKLQSTIDDLREELSTRQKKSDSALADMGDSLEATSKELEQKSEQLSDSNELLQSLQAKHEAETKSTQQALSDAEKKLVNQATELDDLRGSSVEFKNEVERYKTLLDDAKAQAKQNRADADDARIRVDEMQQENSMLYKNNGTLEAQLKMQRDSTTTSLAEKNDVISTLEKRIETQDKLIYQMQKSK